MRVFVVTPPTSESLEYDFKRHVGFEVDEDDDGAGIYLAAALRHLDGPGKWLGRCIGEQTLEARLDGFGLGEIRLPYPEILAVASVKYVDPAGVEQTIDPAAYELLGHHLAPVYGAAWPTPRMQREAVRIRYQAGYRDPAPGTSGIPSDLQAAIFLMAADLFRSRETFTAGVSVATVPMSTPVETLLWPYRVFH
jgi:uncharacterized phiE125 gp8 family phage protein